jgi:short-subunit dehydrogenase
MGIDAGKSYDRTFALVTGASSGIGKALALELAIVPRFSGIILTGRKKARLDEVKILIDEKRESEGLAKNFTTVIVQADIATEDGIAHLREATSKKYNISFVAANAGAGGAPGPDIEQSDIDLDSMIHTNIRSTVLISRSYATDMCIEKGGNGGIILITGSVTSLYGVPNAAVYAASKAFGK